MSHDLPVSKKMRAVAAKPAAGARGKEGRMVKDHTVPSCSFPSFWQLKPFQADTAFLSLRLKFVLTKTCTSPDESHSQLKVPDL